MSIRLRLVEGVWVALCAARSIEKEGDIYLDDAHHHALSAKFSADFASMGFGPDIPYDPEHRLAEQEESNNPNREWWDSVYARANV